MSLIKLGYNFNYMLARGLKLTQQKGSNAFIVIGIIISKDN